MNDKITMDLIGIAIFSLAVALFVLKIHIAKSKLEKKKPIDKEKVKQELKVLKLNAQRLERDVILGYIPEEVYQEELAKIDKRLKELESLYEL